MMFQPGERVTLVHTDDPYTRLRPGDTGTVTGHHQTSSRELVHVAWDDGSRLSMCLDEGDRIARIPTAVTPPTRPAPAPGAPPGCTPPPPPAPGR